MPYGNEFLCDTPGFSSIELNCFKEDLPLIYPGFSIVKEECFFSNCLHNSEKKCAIKKAVSEGIIDKIDYELYLSLLNNLPYRKDRYSL